ncbi:putative bifunctional diguanylate cyclase/phosphodiesterase [Piscinibacter sp.]|uniref:putative bifunctional diguanylate cyclase/phosphodiesterase n=1 Tax=Piscinibacter sp. TaxID=1903157 RepID=UPI002D002AF0|nr:EAL domain-containing protein [Albitalea sp.]HUG25671.1 EAL domain-containing protein [Albitalea sp.]
MDLRRAFVKSTIGWRVFVLYMLAAALPVGLLAFLSNDAIEAASRRALLTSLAGNAKAASLLTVDRLRVARNHLEAPAPRSESDPIDDADPPVIEAAARLQPADVGTAAVGRLAPSQIAAVLAAAVPGDRRDLLAVVPSIGRGHRTSVVIAHALAGGAWQVAVVNPDFLWQETGDLPPGMWACILGPRREVLFCSDDGAQKRAQSFLAASPTPGGRRVDAEAQAVSREVFLAGRFATAGWTTVAGASAEAGGGHAPWGSSIPAAAIAGILIAALLSLTQLRRMLVPLERLTAGAKALAAGRFGTRIAVSSRDEFEQLAASFNDMAAELQRQFDERDTLAAIDRAIIVQQPDLNRLLAEVASRLARLLPNTVVAVGRRTSTTAPRFVAHVCGSSLTQRIDDLRATGADAAALIGAPAGLVLREGGEPSAFALPAAQAGCASVECIPVTWRGELCGFITIGSTVPASLPAAIHRQLLELRDRLAVALASAERETQLVSQARNDSLTGLLNRHGLAQELEAAIRRCRAMGTAFSLLYVDVDRFKTVNDSLGHHAGDRVLQIVAERCARLVPDARLLARPAGDEFVLILMEDGHDRATAMGRSLCAALAAPIAVAETTYFLGASVGVAFYPHDGDSADALIRCADIAMYRAKERGSGHVTVFDKRFDTETRYRHWIERDLRGAVAGGELRLHFQPRLHASTGEVTSVEALLRWQHPVRGLIGPRHFVSVAEESDLILELGEWVIDNACHQARQWRDKGLESLRVALNVSVPQLRTGLDDQLLQATRKWGIPPSCIEIEITESVLATDVESVKGLLTRVRAAGFTVAIDDFGTGFSSLAYLRQLPFDILKIDRAFVMDLDDDMTARAVAQSIVALGNALEKRIVAEGVETAGQAKWLTAIGCDELQGYYYGRPVDAGTLTERLAGSVQTSAP